MDALKPVAECLTTNKTILKAHSCTFVDFAFIFIFAYNLVWLLLGKMGAL